MNKSNETEAKLLVAEAGRMLLDEGLAARTWGNVSCRTGEDTMVITPSGMGYENMKADDVVPFNMTTGEWEGAHKPSSEKLIHIAAYRAFPEAEFVIHTHQTYASAIGLSGFDSLSLTDDEKAAFEGIACAKYGLPGSEKLAQNVAAAYESGAHVVLMARHGAVIVGRDREETFARALLLESVCRSACEGQPAVEPLFNEVLAKRLGAALKKEYDFAEISSCAPVLACAEAVRYIPAQLDDAAQMIGARLNSVKPDEKIVLAALRHTGVVLVPGIGAICRAADESDCRALLKLAEKACVCFLHTRARGDAGRLSMFDTMLMRMIYLRKYSKKIGG